ncbi:MAG: NAD(P)/FAD-dependent oxidoreductase [archaeon]
MKDLIIIGAGPAGLSGGIYSSVYNLDTEIIGKDVGGTINEGHTVENYPGLGKTTGEKVAEKFLDHLESLERDITETEATRIEKNGEGFKVITKDGGEYESKALLITTGRKHRKLNIPGEEKYRGKGVSYCAVCDAPLFKDAEVGVVGGSDSAAKEALLLTEHAEKVYIIYRKDEIRPEPMTKKKIYEKVEEGKIEIINNTNVKEVKGDQMMNKVILDNPYKGNEELEIEGLFINIGGVPTIELLKNLDIDTSKRGEIKVDEEMSTNVPGVYAAGDVTDNNFKQVITAAYQGSRSIQSIFQYLQER